MNDKLIWKEIAQKTALFPTSLVTLAVIFELPVKWAIPVGIITFLLGYPCFYLVLRVGISLGLTAGKMWDMVKKILS